METLGFNQDEAGGELGWNHTCGAVYCILMNGLAVFPYLINDLPLIPVEF